MSDIRSPRCAKCGRTMERGLLLDRGRNHLDTNASTWMEGDAQTTFWGGLKTKGREKHAVVTFRCDGCGYLESYAPASPDSPA